MAGLPFLLLKNAAKSFSVYNLSSVNRCYCSAVVNQMVALQQMEMCAEPPSRGLVLGVYADIEDKTDPGLLTDAAWNYNINSTGGRLMESLKLSGPVPKPGEARFFFGIEPEKVPYFSGVAVVGLGKECLGYNTYEVIDEQKEVIRRSVGAAVREFTRLCTRRIQVESCGHAESAAEGAALGTWMFQEYRERSKRYEMPHLDLYPPSAIDPCDFEGWNIGLQKAAAQNLTRFLQEMPPNVLTPTGFAQNVVDVLCKSGVNVELKVEGWAEAQSMSAFLSVAKASCEPPIFLELSYYGTNAETRPIVIVGQGVTYDSGGICLKSLDELFNMRGAMTGAAVVVATCRAVAALRLPVNIRGLIPLCENLVGCNAFKPGDTVKSMNGKFLEMQSADHGQFLVLADALLYGQNFCPQFVVDVGTPSGSMRHALAESACGIFTNSEILWQKIKNASMHTGDRVWRFPLWDYYTQQIAWSDSTDIQSYGKGRGGRPCKIAAFLREFVPCGQWMHVDATNVMYTEGTDFEYLSAGMAGRPTRTLIEFIAQSTCKDTAPVLKAFSKPK